MMKPLTDDSSADRIAIIGMSGRFPGAANPAELWRNLLRGDDSISRFDPESLEYSNASAALRADGQRFAAARGVLENADLFDAAFFGIPSMEAEVMDPQHRVFLECAWEAMEDAGYDSSTYSGLVGVFAGASFNTYLLHHLCAQPGYASRLAGLIQAGEYSAYVGNDKDFLPTRVSYRLDLRGPSLSVQTACSSSLVAVSQACDSLLAYQSDMALAGGVSITFPQKRDYPCTAEGMMSLDGYCRAFDAGANGTVFGHGAGIVVLKRLSDALADRDQILGVILGSAVNNDGQTKVGFAAPSVSGQAAAIMMAQAAAGVSPDEFDYIEAHGTGTPLGDPVEVAALNRAFRQRGVTGEGFCRIGSAKTYIGHLDAAAGVVGLIKTVLQLKHEKIAPLLHFQSPNPKVDFAGSPFLPADQWIDWKRADRPRIAGVTSLGVGGTNAHVVVCEAPGCGPTVASSGRAQLLPFSAKSTHSLERMRCSLAACLRATPSLEVPDVAFTLQEGRRAFGYRSFGIGDDLVSVAHSLDHARAVVASAGVPKVVFLFPGQGSQVAGMGCGLENAEPVYRAAIEECAQILARHGVDDLLALIGSSANSRALAHTSVAQPAIFSVSYALARLWMSWGIRPSVLIGHSVGEYVAAVISGYWNLEEALTVLTHRARLQASLPAGGMLAVRSSVESLEPLLIDGTCIAAVNSHRMCTVSGTEEALARLEASLIACGVAVQKLQTSHAFHSDMMDPMLDEFAASTASFPGRSPIIPWVSTCSGNWVTLESIPDASYWSQQVRQPVLFSAALDKVVGLNDHFFLEVGPGRALSSFAVQHPNRLPANRVASSIPDAGVDSDGRSMMLRALGELWTSGAEPDWNAVRSDAAARRVSLPTYPFERQRFWVDSPVGGEIVREEAAIEASVPPKSVEVVVNETTVNRRQRLENAVTDLLNRLSGLEIKDIDLPLTEYGFDSLSLTQACTALHSTFGVLVTFRQLLCELSSVRALTDLLDRTMPELTLDAVLEDPEKPDPSGGQRYPVTKWPGGESPGGASSSRFGPYKPVQRGSDGNLPPERQAWLDELIARYVAKTLGSKAYTAKNRKVFADPRAVSGFNHRWKEMVYPIVADFSKGAQIRDIDGHAYVDVTMGFGAYFFGHSPDFVINAVRDQLGQGIEIGPQNALAGEVAAEICALSGMDRVTFCNTGSEAVMAAIRLARTVTGRNRIVFFSGDYHGMFDEVLARSAWPQGVYRPVAAAPGIPPGLVENVLILEYGDRNSLRVLKEHKSEIAAVIVEPVQGRNPGLQPKAFLKELRQVCSDCDVPLVFDEVVTGFRCHPGGAQAFFGVQADLAAYGKVVGGGIPVDVLAGRSKFMDALDGGDWQYGDDSAPEAGMTFFAGTFVRHPLAMAAMKAVLHFLKKNGPGLQIRMKERVSRLIRQLNDDFVEAGVPMRFATFSSWAWLEHGADPEYVSLFWYLLRERGVHWWEGRPMHLTLAHADEDFDHVVRAFREATAEMQTAGFLPRQHRTMVTTVLEEFYPREDQVATTEAVREILLACQMGDEASCGYNEAGVLDFRGALVFEAMRRALGCLIQRHAALRSRFSSDGSLQFFADILLGEDTFELPLIDLSATNPVEAESRWQEVKGRETLVPFDLENGPLFRAKLIRHTNVHHSLLFTAHHAVCDGWSFGMIIAELGEIYGALVYDRIPLLPPPYSFADYARSMALQRSSGATAADEEYWMRKFSDLPRPLELPTDHIRPSMRDYAGAMAVRVIEREAFQKLKTCASRDGGTLFSFALAAFATLLRRLTNHDDFVIGVPAAGQVAVGQDYLIGHCLNFLPIRLRPSGEALLSDWIRHVGQEVLSAQEHQSVTLGTLLGRLKLPRDPSRMPLVQVMFNIDRSGLDRVQFHGLEFQVSTNPKQLVNFELFFNLVQTDARIEIECEYLTSLFDHATISAWLEAYERILVAMCDSPQLAIDSTPLVTDQCLLRWNDTTRHWSSEDSVHRMFALMAQQVPHRVAVRSGERVVTYAALSAMVRRLAASLVASGVSEGDLVGLCVSRNEFLPAGILAVMQAQAAYVPVDRDLPEARRNTIIKAAGIRVMLADADSPEFPGLQLIRLESAADEELPGLRDDVECNPESPAYVMFTSGSTGEPKGVIIPHRALTNFLHSMRESPGISESDVLLAVTTFTFDISVLELLLPLVCGACVVVATQEVTKDPSLMAAEIDRRQISLLQATPTTWQLLLESGWSGRSELKALVGGEAVHRDLVNRLVPLCGAVWNLYGPTEATIWCSLEKLDAGSGPVLIGRPLANTTLHVVNDQGQEQIAGVPGELWIGGAGLATGYLGRPDLTATRFIEDLAMPGRRVYQSGDLARRLADGRIECLGRNDDQVKLRGFRIELGEIEALLEQHSQILQAVVVLRRDVAGTPHLCALLRTQNCEKSESDLVSELRAYLGQKLPPYSIPARFEQMDRFPLTANGKIDRKGLAETHFVAQHRRDKSEALAVPATELEVLLLRIVSERLSAPQLGLEQDVFESGADSLSVFQICINAGRAGMPIRPMDVFKCRNVRAICARLQSRASDVTPSRKQSVPAAFEVIKIRDGGDGAPFVFFNSDWVGQGGYMIKVAEMLPKANAIYTVSAYHFGTDAIPDFGAAASSCADAIQLLGDGRGLVLGGFCIGGWMATETATILKSRGVAIHQVVLLDPPEPSAPIIRLAWHLGERFARSPSTRSRLDRMEALHSLQRWFRHPWGKKFHKLLFKLGWVARDDWDDSDGVDFGPEQDIAYGLYLLSLAIHRLGLCDLPVLLLGTENTGEPFRRHHYSAHFAADLLVKIVPGNHLSCVQEDLPTSAEAIAEVLHQIPPAAREV